MPRLLLISLVFVGCNNDYGTCDPSFTNGLPASDPTNILTGRYLYAVGDYTTVDACMKCTEPCQEFIESEFADENPGRELDILCGPMWIAGECVLDVSITDIVEDTGGGGWPSTSEPVNPEGVVDL